MFAKLLNGLAGLAVASILATSALAESDMEKALAGGAVRLSSDQIVARLAGNTVTFEFAKNGDRWLVFYDEGNGMALRKVGTDKVIEGFYATTLDDRICFGITAKSPMRLRCLGVLDVGGQLQKYETDGSLRGRVVEMTAGNST
ncbi:MAG: hypothetical protein D6754_05650 [Alphaproteobacteria bacterium]|nr:MAG: hypothetical protein D6754_05650 [Alphaproteobacteria bacterium]